ncbi:hypothetical protein IQ241_00430 [Romeria aff. gracilis LEGE 07310]|uniref:Uncharacterized protein n=1 Tax=Vasconcelosia minhoensis LEGE 07310 TaxID=915328 RepID=A0A8J7A9R3_9CYAN|nr:hypothetical protein [Romeria gracilis]MBE9075779.1 hypothetical protein [Romeria aff. gracilis LEGE 07310]
MNASAASQPVTSLSLSDLRETVGLVRDRDDPFFHHWLSAADPLSDYEQQALERLKQNYSDFSMA